MMPASIASSAAAADKGRDKKRPRQPVGGPHLGRDTSPEAKRLAAAILEVLAGVRTTADAATAVGLSLTRYYQVESRALAGFLRACEAPPKGRRHSVESDLAALRRDNERLQRDLARQQALVRLGQRSVGLVPPAPAAKAKPNGKKPRRRRPVVRALQVAARLQAGPASAPDTGLSLQQGSRETSARDASGDQG